MQADPSSPERLPLYESAPLALALFVFWVVLSGKFDLFHLAAGALSATGIAYLSCYLYALPPPVGPHGRHPYFTFPWFRMAAYLPWLGWQIVAASFQVARIVLSPTLKITPRLFRFSHELPHNLARATLANSITLTPGTVTIDVRGDEYLVHALNDEAAEALQRTDAGNMKTRVSSIFRGDT
jgi:multicomponent Na+:H+ antiporter subunit E